MTETTGLKNQVVYAVLHFTNAKVQVIAVYEDEETAQTCALENLTAYSVAWVENCLFIQGKWRE